MMSKRGPKLGELCTIIDCEHKTAPTEDAGIPLIRTPNIGNGRLKLGAVQRISQETYSKWTRRGEPRPGDLIMAREAPVGNVAIVSPNEIVCLGQRTVLIRITSSDVDPSFLNYLLNSKQVKERTILLSNGATVGHLNVTDIRNFELPSLPKPLAQRKIAAILTAYDDLIETNKRRIALLEKMAEEIYREWFVRMRFPGYRTVKFVKGVPEGWEPMPSSNMFDVLSGGTPKTDVPRYWDGPIPFFTPKDAPDHIYVSTTEKLITEKGLNSCNSRLYPKNTIFITARGTVGKLALAQCNMAMNQSCYALVPKFDEEIFFFYLSMSNAIEIVKGVSKSGVFDNIIIDTFRIIPIYFPGRPLIKNFNEIAAPIFSQLESLLSANASLAKTRDLLLPRLISGKLSVADLDIQFPPSMSEAIKDAD